MFPEKTESGILVESWEWGNVASLHRVKKSPRSLPAPQAGLEASGDSCSDKTTRDRDHSNLLQALALSQLTASFHEQCDVWPYSCLLYGGSVLWHPFSTVNLPPIVPWDLPSVSSIPCGAEVSAASHCSAILDFSLYSSWNFDICYFQISYLIWFILSVGRKLFTIFP